MTKEEYFKQRKDLRLNLDTAELELAKKYAIANNPYKVGDRVTDHIGTIEIEKMTLSFTSRNDVPCLTYYGSIVNKDGSFRKNGERRNVWQSNIISHE